MFSRMWNGITPKKAPLACLYLDNVALTSIPDPVKVQQFSNPYHPSQPSTSIFLLFGNGANVPEP
jgi:hypothetical protein